MLEIEKLTFKQCVNCIAVMNLLLKENVINFNPDEAVATLNYDEAMRYLENQNIEQDKEIKRLNNTINECADEILKELKENSHLSYGVALAIRQKLINYRELKESGNNE